MPFNKGDFTQQGVAGDVSALVRLNEKRVMKVVLSSDDESDNCDISGAVYDLLNEEVYPIGAGVSGNIEITENGENINVAPFATATVNVSGGGGLPTMALTLINDTNKVLYLGELSAPCIIQSAYGIISMVDLLDIDAELNLNLLYDYTPGLMGSPDVYQVQFTYVDENQAMATANITNLVNCTVISSEFDTAILQITDPSQPSSATVTAVIR